MKAELYMTSPEQEFSTRSLAEGPHDAAQAQQAGPNVAQWARAWALHSWLRAWQLRSWQLHWNRAWMLHHWFMHSWQAHWMPPPYEERPELDLSLEQIATADPRAVDQPAVAVKPIVQRLLLREEREGFLALDTLSSKVFKLDKQAGEFVQAVQGGKTRDEAVKRLGVKNKDVDELLDFLNGHEPGQGALSNG